MEDNAISNQQQVYQSWKPTILGKVLDTDGVKEDNGQCSQVDLSYGEALFPGVPWYQLFPPTPNAKDFGRAHNDTYFGWIPNDHNNPNQLPVQGDIGVFDATPQAGYDNQTINPSGHTGVFDSASPSGYALLQENAPAYGQSVNVTSYAWKFRPCLGWLRPRLSASAPAPVPTPAGSPLVGKQVWLHAVPSWHVYRVGAQPVLANAIGFLIPKNYNHGPQGQPGLTYQILAVSKWPNTVTIQTDTYGEVDIYLDGDAQVL